MSKMNGTSAIVITLDKTFGAIHMTTTGRNLSPVEVKTIKGLGFNWQRKEHYWYADYSAEKVAEIKASFLGKEATFPSKLSKADEKELSETADARIKAREARQAERKATRPTKQAASPADNARVEALEQNVAALTDMMGQMMQTLQGLTAPAAAPNAATSKRRAPNAAKVAKAAC